MARRSRFRDFGNPGRITAQASEELGPESINEYIKVVKMVVASGKDPKTREQLYPVFWDSEYLDLPIVEGETRNVPRSTARR